MSKQSSGGKRRKATALWLSVVVLALIAGAVVWHTGLPSSLLSLFSRILSTANHIVTVESAYSPRPGEFRLMNLRIARRGVATPAWFQTEAATWSWRPVRTLALSLRGVEVSRPTRKRKNPSRAPGNPQYWPSARFDLEAEEVKLLGLALSRIQAECVIRRGTLELKNLVVVPESSFPDGEHLSGAMNVDLETGGIAGSLEGTLFPEDLRPVLNALSATRLARLMDRFEFPGSPPSVHCTIAFDPMRNVRRLRIDISGAPCVYRGVGLESVSARIEAGGDDRWAEVRIENLIATHPEGILSGEMNFNLLDSLLSTRSVSTLPLRPLAAVIGIRQPAQGILLPSPPLITVTGRIDMAGTRSRTDLNGSASVSTAQVGGVALHDVALSFHIDKTAYDISSLQAVLANGNLDGRLLWWRDRQGGVTGRQARVLLSDADVNGFFSQILDRPVDLAGSMDLGVTLSIPPGEENLADAITGAGEMKLLHTRLFRLPLFSGLTDILADSIPGVESLVSQTEAFCPFRIEHGKFTTENAMIEGDIFSLNASGEYHFTNRLDFVIQLRFLRSRSLGGKVMRVVGYPISKLFEVHLEGPIENPEWRVLRILDQIMPDLSDK